MEVTAGRAEYGGSCSSPAGPIPYVLPGELVRIRLEGAPEVIEPSRDRVRPGCVHFGECGGCQYQHAEYEAQLGLKRELLGDLLAGASLGALPEIATHAGEPWGYRNRIRLRVQAEPGGLRLGYSRRGTNDFLPIQMCRIAAPLLWRAAETLLQLAAESSLAARWLGAAAEVELFCAPDERALQAQFFLRDGSMAGARESFAGFCEQMRDAIPELVGVGAAPDPELSRKVRRGWEGVAWGAPGLSYPAAGRSFWVSRGAFFQVNRFLVDRLVELVCADAGGELGWDLFAGVGLFTRALAERMGRIVAVEGGAAAADLALAGSSGRGYEAVHGATLAFLQARQHQRERPDLVVLDPPRAGLGAEGSRLLARIGPPSIRYVSCDPVTLARDLTVLVRGGYRVERLDLVDLFPQTYHLETVARLVKAGAP